MTCPGPWFAIANLDTFLLGRGCDYQEEFEGLALAPLHLQSARGNFLMFIINESVMFASQYMSDYFDTELYKVSWHDLGHLGEDYMDDLQHPSASTIQGYSRTMVEDHRAGIWLKQKDYPVFVSTPTRVTA